MPSSSPWTFSRQGVVITPTAPFCIELCAGSGRLTATLRRFGLDAWAVDHKKGKIQSETAATLLLDLADDADTAALLRLIEHPLLIFVAMSPPCGTCSRARDRAVPGVPGGGPPPLRSEQYPEGFPDLEARLPHEFLRVVSANAVYLTIAKVAAKLILKKVAFFIENPRNSIFWFLIFIKQIADNPVVDTVTFQNCMYDGKRNKWTKLIFYPQELFTSLHRVCDNSHIHEPWGRSSEGAFATAAETVYPQAFCDAVLDCLSAALHLRRGLPLPVSRARGEVHPQRVRDDRASAGLQPRGTRARRLLPEFRATLQIKGDCLTSDPRCKIGHLWPTCTINGITVPANAKTIAVTFTDSASSPTSGAPGQQDPTTAADIPTRACLKYVGANNLLENDVYIGRAHRPHSGRLLAASPWANPFKLKDCSSIDECLGRFRTYLYSCQALLRRLPELANRRLVCHCLPGSPCHGDILKEAFIEQCASHVVPSIITVGVYYMPEEFINAALRLKHPFELFALPSPLVTCIRFRMTSSVQAVISARRQALEHWRSRARHLQPAEAHLHTAMHPEVAAVMSDKNLKLFGEMLSSVGFPNHAALIHLMSVGFPVAGSFPKTGIFPPADRVASLTIADLWKDSHKIRAAAAAKRPTSTDDLDLATEVFEATLVEVKKGWLTGPTSIEALNQRLGRWIPNRRFGVRQGRNIRCIDDFSASGVNETLSAVETVDPDGLDRIAVNVRGHLDAFTSPSSSRPSSSPFAGSPRHPDHAECRLVARLWDLEAAYRQLPRSPSHASLTVISVFDPASKQHLYFEQTPLAFGASASVLSFNWVAEAIKTILISIFLVATTSFYDDFTVIEIEKLAADAKITVESLMALLGWRLKELDDFSAESTPLGAILDLSRCREGVATIKNKPARVQEIIGALDVAAASEVVPASLLPKLRGRLLFARSLSFGRCGGDALRALGAACHHSGSTVTIRGQLAHALFNLRQYLVSARPREIRVSHPAPPVVFLTDLLNLFQQVVFRPASAASSSTLARTLSSSSGPPSRTSRSASFSANSGRPSLTSWRSCRCSSPRRSGITSSSTARSSSSSTTPRRSPLSSLATPATPSLRRSSARSRRSTLPAAACRGSSASPAQPTRLTRLAEVTFHWHFLVGLSPRRFS